MEETETIYVCGESSTEELIGFDENFEPIIEVTMEKENETNNKA